MLAPVAIFAYKRVKLLQQTIAALKKNDMSEDTCLYIFSDGAATPLIQPLVSEVRDYVNTISGFKSVTLCFRDSNLGLAANLEDGVSHVLKHHNTVIVLEDDIVTSPSFLSFMNDALSMYKYTDAVAQICAYSFIETLATSFGIGDSYFVLGSDCLAWATWRRAWCDYSPDSEALAYKLKARRLVSSFNRSGSYNYFRMLRNNGRTGSRSWAVNFHAVNYLLSRYTLYPKVSLALHLGTDEHATNYVSRKRDPLLVRLSEIPVRLEELVVTELPGTTKAFNSYLRGARGSLISRALDLLRIKVLALQKLLSNNSHD